MYLCGREKIAYLTLLELGKSWYKWRYDFFVDFVFFSSASLFKDTVLFSYRLFALDLLIILHKTP